MDVSYSFGCMTWWTKGATNPSNILMCLHIPYLYRSKHQQVVQHVLEVQILLLFTPNYMHMAYDRHIISSKVIFKIKMLNIKPVLKSVPREGTLNVTKSNNTPGDNSRRCLYSSSSSSKSLFINWSTIAVYAPIFFLWNISLNLTFFP